MQIPVHVHQLGRRGPGADANHAAIAIAVYKIARDPRHLDLGQEPSLSHEAEVSAVGGLNLTKRTVLPIELSSPIMSGKDHMLVRVIQEQAALTTTRGPIRCAWIELGRTEVSHPHLTKELGVTGNHLPKHPLSPTGAALGERRLPAPLPHQIIRQLQNLTTIG